jgi:hypothetical protein
MILAAIGLDAEHALQMWREAKAVRQRAQTRREVLGQRRRVLRLLVKVAILEIEAQGQRDRRSSARP